MRVLLHSGGVAFAQPPATSFYPCQDADFQKGYHCNALGDWRQGADACLTSNDGALSRVYDSKPPV